MSGFLKGCLIVVVAVLAIGGWLVYSCTRSAAGMVSDGIATVQRRFDGEWDAEERKADPVGYFDHLIAKLRENVKELDESSRQLEVAGANIVKSRDESAARRVGIAAELERLKAKYREASSGAATWPVDLDGKSWSEEALKRRTATLLGQHEALGEVDRRFAATLTSAEKTREDIFERILDTEGQISVLGAEREIVKVGRVTGDVEKLFAEAGDVIVKNQKTVTSSPVRSIEELMKDRGVDPARPATGSVDAFLTGK